jgi:hypothetical protein
VTSEPIPKDHRDRTVWRWSRRRKKLEKHHRPDPDTCRGQCGRSWHGGWRRYDEAKAKRRRVGRIASESRRRNRARRGA